MIAPSPSLYPDFPSDYPTSKSRSSRSRIESLPSELEDPSARRVSFKAGSDKTKSRLSRVSQSTNHSSTSSSRRSGIERIQERQELRASLQAVGPRELALRRQEENESLLRSRFWMKEAQGGSPIRDRDGKAVPSASEPGEFVRAGKTPLTLWEYGFVLLLFIGCILPMILDKSILKDIGAGIEGAFEGLFGGSDERRSLEAVGVLEKVGYRVDTVDDLN